MLQLVILDFDGTLADTRDLSVPASEALVVGDMPVDIQMGLGAGTRTCGVSYGNANRDALLAAGAHYVIDDFAQLEQGIIDDTKWDQEISKEY